MYAHAKDLRKGRLSSSGNIYSVTVSTYRKSPVFADFYLARKLVQSFKTSDIERTTKTIGFVIMPDHFHWLFQLGEKYDLSKAVARAKGRAALAVNQQRNCIQKVWQSGFHDRCLRKDDDTVIVMRYIIATPLRAGLVRSVRDYSHWDCVYI
ncbi:transposase [Alteromonadaceae bacterium M269]|nr:transposase [Alteromonadaceae bacterium M269]